MDPNATLGELLAIARGLVDVPDEHVMPNVDAVRRLAALTLDLDGWLHKGGFKPQRWSKP